MASSSAIKKLPLQLESVTSPITTTANLREKRKSKRFRPSPALYKFTYSVLVARDGERCSLQGPDCEGHLEIHHADGRRETWTLDKLRLLCIHHNRVFQRTTSVIERERKDVPELNISYESRRSLELGPTFRLELERLITESASREHLAAYHYHGVTVKEAEDRLAGICGCDQQVARRWLDRNTLPLDDEAPYFLSERTVSDGRKKRTAQFVNRKQAVHKK